jgi:hypothetical protein
MSPKSFMVLGLAILMTNFNVRGRRLPLFVILFNSVDSTLFLL